MCVDVDEKVDGCVRVGGEGIYPWRWEFEWKVSRTSKDSLNEEQ